MPRTYSSIDKIRAELAWGTETPDPNKCGCRNLRCREETGHNPGECAGVVATKFWTFRWGRTTDRESEDVASLSQIPKPESNRRRNHGTAKLKLRIAECVDRHAGETRPICISAVTFPCWRFIHAGDVVRRARP